MRKFLPIFVLFFSAGVMFGSSVVVKKYRTLADFLPGKAEGVTIRHDGSMALAPRVQPRMQGEVAQIWKLARAGKVLYAAAGAPAAVLRLASNGDTTVVFRGTEAAVFALCADAAGNLFFSPAPGGAIYRYAKGRLDTLATLETKYVWDLLPWHGGIVAATGLPGSVLQITPAGRIDTLFKSAELHIRTLARDAKGNLLFGSSDNGIVYRMTPAGKVSVLYDSPQTEIFDVLATTSGEVWAAGAKEGVQLPGPSPAPQVSVTGISIEEGHRSRISSASGASLPSRRNGGRNKAKKGAIYRIAENGYAQEVWDDRFDRVQSLALAGDGSLLVGTGEQGRIYRLRADNSVDLLLDLAPSQITFMLPEKNGVLVATANLGACFVLQKQPVREGKYTSKVIDTKVHSKWGSLSWRSSGSVSFQTRSGNSQEPDETWSAWGKTLTTATASPIDAPPARFLQWRALLKSGRTAPAVMAVDVGYMQSNLAPAIASITVYEPGVAFLDAVAKGLRAERNAPHANDGRNAPHASDGRNGRAARNSSRGKKEILPGYQSVGWDASDANGDQLRFDLYYKHVASGHWRVLVSGYRGGVYSWDGRTLADGEYIVKIVATDARSNTPEEARRAEKLSDTFVIDNSPPVISPPQLRKGTPASILFSAKDEHNRITQAYYALDANDWVLIYPQDGISDTKAETYVLSLEGQKPGHHEVAMKVYDENLNVQYAHFSFSLQE